MHGIQFNASFSELWKDEADMSILKYILKKILQAIPIFLVVSIAVFILLKMAPGDPLIQYAPSGNVAELTPEARAALEKSLGLDGSYTEQYLRWLSNILHGNWGQSIINRQPVLELIFDKLGATLGLMGAGLLIALILSIPLGILSGQYENRWPDKVIGFFSYLGISIPQFWFGIILILIFSLKMKLVPASGMRTIGIKTTSDLLRHAVLPVIVLVFNNLAVFVRYLRANVIDEKNEEYVLTALSKGCSGHRVLFGHVAKNCMIPIITLVGLNLVNLFAGSFIVESVFAWPGIGMLIMNAIRTLDYPLVMGATMFSCLFLLVGSMLTDILYRVADPRIR